MARKYARIFVFGKFLQFSSSFALEKHFSFFWEQITSTGKWANLKATVYIFRQMKIIARSWRYIHSLLCVVLYIASVLCFSSVNTFSFCCAYLHLHEVGTPFPSRKKAIKLLFKIFLFRSRKLCVLFSFKQVIKLLTSFNSYQVGQRSLHVNTG